MADFDPIYSSTLQKEGGYKLTNSAGDNGGQTYAGISRKSNPGWSGWAYVDRGEIPPTPLVRSLYREKYWTPMRLDEVRDQRIAESLYEFGFVAGIKVSAKLAQVVVGVEPDGQIGDKSLAALNGMSSPDLFLARFTIAKIARYRDIVMRDRSQSKWLLGWLNRALEGAT
jgi:lysozyme family protein